MLGWRLLADASKPWRPRNKEGTLPRAQERSTTSAGQPFQKKISMNELVKLRQQIAEMEKQAAELQKKNRPAILAELRQQMAAYGITVEELSRPAAKAAKPGATGQDNESGQSQEAGRALAHEIPRPPRPGLDRPRQGPCSGLSRL